MKPLILKSEPTGFAAIPHVLRGLGSIVTAIVSCCLFFNASTEELLFVLDGILMSGTVQSVERRETRGWKDRTVVRYELKVSCPDAPEGMAKMFSITSMDPNTVGKKVSVEFSPKLATMRLAGPDSDGSASPWWLIAILFLVAFLSSNYVIYEFSYAYRYAADNFVVDPNNPNAQ